MADVAFARKHTGDPGEEETVEKQQLVSGYRVAESRRYNLEMSVDEYCAYHMANEVIGDRCGDFPDAREWEVVRNIHAQCLRQTGKGGEKSEIKETRNDMEHKPDSQLEPNQFETVIISVYSVFAR